MVRAEAQYFDSSSENSSEDDESQYSADNFFEADSDRERKKEIYSNPQPSSRLNREIGEESKSEEPVDQRQVDVKIKLP